MKDILRFRGSLFNFYLTRVHKNANLPDPRRNETDPRVIDADPPPMSLRVSPSRTFFNGFVFRFVVQACTQQCLFPIWIGSCRIYSLNFTLRAAANKSTSGVVV